MDLRPIADLTAAQKTRLSELLESIEGEDLLVEVDGLDSRLRQFVGRVWCPYNGWESRDMMLVGIYVFARLHRSEYNAERIAAEYALLRDTSYGL